LPPPALTEAPKLESPPFVVGPAPPPIQTTLTLVTPSGTVQVYVPAVVYCCSPGGPPGSFVIVIPLSVIDPKVIGIYVPSKMLM
jgi:hypothetical protein